MIDHDFYNCEITVDSGETYRVYANWLHNENLDHWQDFECDAGKTRLFIDSNFNVYSGECMNDHLGHALNGFTVFREPTTCKKERCTGCTDDLTVTKREKP